MSLEVPKNSGIGPRTSLDSNTVHFSRLQRPIHKPTLGTIVEDPPTELPELSISKQDLIKSEPRISLDRYNSSSRVSEVGILIKHGKLKKMVGSALMLLGGIPKTILNLPILKEYSQLASGGGLLIGGTIGLIIGSLLFHPKKGAKIGGRIGYLLLDPRTIFIGICNAGDSLLKSGGVPIATRALLNEITNVPIVGRQYEREEFVEKEYKKFLFDAVKLSMKNNPHEKKFTDKKISKAVSVWLNLNKNPELLRLMSSSRESKSLEKMQMIDGFLGLLDKTTMLKKIDHFEKEINSLGSLSGSVMSKARYQLLNKKMRDIYSNKL